MLRVRPSPGSRAALSGWERARASQPCALSGARRAWRRGASRLARVSGVALGLLPAWAWACPVCVERPPESAGSIALLLGAILLAPFLMVALGAWAARRAARDDTQGSA